MADDRLDIPKVKQGRKRSFTGFQQQIESAASAAAQFDAFASDMFADAAHDAKRKGVEAGRSAISLNTDGTVTRLPVPESGQIFMEAYADQQRAAHLSATQQSFDSKTRDLMLSLERDKDRDAKFKDQFEAMANTFINSAPDDIKQDINLKAELLGSSGARAMARITAKEEFNENKAIAIDNIKALSDRARSVARTMADYPNDEAISKEDIAPLAEAQKALIAAREAGFLTPEAYIEAQDNLTAILIEGRLHKEFAGINKNSLELTKRLQQFVDNPKSVLGKDVPLAMRAQIAKSIIQEITARNRAINSERAEINRVQKLATIQLSAWVLQEEQKGTLLTPQDIRDQADKLGVNRELPESRLAVEKLTGASTKKIQTRIIDDELVKIAITGVFSEEQYKNLILTARNDTGLQKKVKDAFKKYFIDLKKDADKTDATTAEVGLNIQIDNGDLKADDIRQAWNAISYELQFGFVPAIDGSVTPPRKEKDLNPREKYIFNNRDKLIERADKIALAISGMTKAETRMWDEINKSGGRATNQAQANLLARRTGVGFENPDQVSDFVKKNNGFVPDIFYQGFIRLGGMQSAEAVYTAALMLKRSGLTQLPEKYNTPEIVATMEYIAASHMNNGHINDMGQENQEKTLGEVKKIIDSAAKKLPDQQNQQLAADLENASEDLRAHLENNVGFLHQRFTGGSLIRGEKNWAQQLALNEFSGSDPVNALFGVNATVQGKAEAMLSKIYKTELRMNPSRNKKISLNKALHRFMSKFLFGYSSLGEGDDLMKNLGASGHMMFPPEKLQAKITPTDRERNNPKLMAELPTIGEMIQRYPNIARVEIVREVMSENELDHEAYGSPEELALDEGRFFLEAIPSLSNPNQATYRVFLKDREGNWRQFGDINAYTVLDPEFGRKVLNIANLRQNMFLGGIAPRLTGKLSINFNNQLSNLRTQTIHGEGPLAPWMEMGQIGSRIAGRQIAEGIEIYKWAIGDNEELPDPEIAEPVRTSMPIPPPRRSMPQLTPGFENLIDSGVDADDELLDPLSNFTLSNQDRKVFQRIESSGRANAVQGSSIGLYQFELKTAQDLMPGVTKADLRNPVIQEELLDIYTERNAKQLGTTDPYVLYMAHQQGVRGYRELLKIKDVRIKDIRDSNRKRKVMANRLPSTKRNKNATVGDFLDEWKRHYFKLKQEV